LNCGVNLRRFRLAIGHSSGIYHASRNVHETGGAPTLRAVNSGATGHMTVTQVAETA